MAESRSLVAAGNTYNPCLLILRGKGYELWVEEGENQSYWNARKEGRYFMAYSPPELLGIAVLFEEYGEQWNQQSPDVIGEICENKPD